ncbi:MAG TPA: YkvA family protein [Acidimicrobiia bacterium]|nr:YkvA family protein [Acidimicrobiia bacterium]
MAATQGGGKGWQLMQVLRQGLGGAERLVRNPKELLSLLTRAERRLDRINAGRLTPIKEDVQTLLRLMRAYGEGRYRQVSGKNLALAGLAIMYLVSPLDVVPDFLPGGFVDDAAVIGFIVKKVRTELAAFEIWEQAQGSQDGWR